MSSRHSAASLLRTAAADSKSNLEGRPSSAPASASSSSSSIVAANNSSTGLNPTNGNVRSPSDGDGADGDGRPFHVPPKSNNGDGEQRTSAASLLLAASSTFARASGLTNEDDDGFEEDSKFAAADGYNTNGGYNADDDGDSYNAKGGSSYNRTESSTTVLAKAAAAKDGSGGSILAVKSECCRQLLRGIESLEVAAAAADVAAAADGRNDIVDEDTAADEDEKKKGRGDDSNGGSNYNTESSTNGGSVLAASTGRGNRLLSSGSNFSSPSGSGSGRGIGSLNVAGADDDGRDDISKSLEDLLAVARNGGLHGLPEEQQRKLLEFVVKREAATSDALDGLPTTPAEIVYFMEASMYEHSWALEMYEKYLADNPVIQKHLEEYEATRGVSLVPTHKKAVHASLCLANNKGAEAVEAINEFNGDYSRQLSDIIININGASPSTAARVIQSPAASNGLLTRPTESASASVSSSVGHETLFVLGSLQMADLLLILESKLSAEDIADAMEIWKNANSIGGNPIFRHCETPSDVFHEFDVYHFGTTLGGDTNDNASVADGSASRYVSEEEEEEEEEAGVPGEIAVQAGL